MQLLSIKTGFMVYSELLSNACKPRHKDNLEQAAVGSAPSG